MSQCHWWCFLCVPNPASTKSMELCFVHCTCIQCHLFCIDVFFFGLSIAQALNPWNCVDSIEPMPTQSLTWREMCRLERESSLDVYTIYKYKCKNTNTKVQTQKYTNTNAYNKAILGSERAFILPMWSNLSQNTYSE